MNLRFLGASAERLLCGRRRDTRRCEREIHVSHRGRPFLAVALACRCRATAAALVLVGLRAGCRRSSSRGRCRRAAPFVVDSSTDAAGAFAAGALAFAGLGAVAAVAALGLARREDRPRRAAAASSSCAR